jgi:hypothetical protein
MANVDRSLCLTTISALVRDGATGKVAAIDAPNASDRGGTGCQGLKLTIF